MPEVAIAPRRSHSRWTRLAAERVRDLDLVGRARRAVAADAQVAAAVDREALAARARRSATRVGGQALAGAAGVELDARAGGATTPCASSTCTRRQRARRMRARGAARRRRGERVGAQAGGRDPGQRGA